MDSLRLLARFAVAVVVLLLFGIVYSLVVGLFGTPRLIVPSLVVLALVVAVVGWLTVGGIRRAVGTETTYW